MSAAPGKQRGTTLLVALIMLVVLMLFLTSSLNTSTTNLKVVGNMQAKTEALAAAQEAIETVISTPQFISSPTDAVASPCGTANTLCSDVTGDETAEYVTTLTPPPTCITVKAIKNSELVETNAEDLGCMVEQRQGSFGVGAPIGDSLCANTVWEISAQTVGQGSAASLKVIQGVGVRISADDAGSSC